MYVTPLHRTIAIAFFAITMACDNSENPENPQSSGSPSVNNDTDRQSMKKLSPPIFSPAPGTYFGKKSIEISSPEGATIYYAFGGMPSTNSPPYSTPISLITSRSIWAFASKDGYKNSDAIHGLFYTDTSSNVAWNKSITYKDLVDSRDGRVYKITVIGQQEWMSENLNFENGKIGRCLSADNRFCEKFGRLYTWSEAMGGIARSDSAVNYSGICPESTRLPNKSDWDTLNAYLKRTSKYKNSAFSAFRLSAKGIWKYDSLITDEYGFRALPTGFIFTDGSGGYSPDHTTYWSSSEVDQVNAATFSLSSSSVDASFGSWNKGFWYSVRCLRNLRK